MRSKAKFHKNPKVFKDYFSFRSLKYSNNRPNYPEKLYRYLLGECREKKIAWDAGTGNGQTAQKLSMFFQKVYATDASNFQILKFSLYY